MAKYINPYTDFGFKKLFGEEGNKDLLIDFLNPEQRDRYEQSLLYYQDLKSILETAVEAAVEEKQIEIAKRMILAGSDNKFVNQMTDLSVEQTKQLRAELKK